MVANPEMVVVDPDAPTDKSVKQALMSLPMWEEWLRNNGFSDGNFSNAGLVREWLNHGRGWRIKVLPANDTIHIIVNNNPRFYGKQLGGVQAAERSVPGVVQNLITEIERKVSDATKKRRIKAYLKSVPVETRQNYTGPNNAMEAGPIHRPVPDDPAELDKSQMDQLLDRIQTRCFLAGQRVQVVTPHRGALAGQKGTVIDAGVNSCYVELDVYAEAGDSDPFRFQADELRSINESTDADAPEPYMAALDYIIPLKQAGYGKSAKNTYRKVIQNEKGNLAIRITLAPDEPKASIYVDYSKEGESNLIYAALVDAIDIADFVRKLEELYSVSSSAADYTDKLEAAAYPNGSVTTQRDHLIHLFGESIVEATDPDDPTPYLAELTRHAEVLNVFRSHGVRLGRRMSTSKPYYNLFYIPSAVTDVSYDIYLEPQGDQSWKVTAEGSKEFQDQVGVDWQEEFEIDNQWNIPVGITGDGLNGIIDEILHDLRKHTGPDEPTVNEPDVDDIDEGIDDPPADAGGLVPQKHEDLYRQEGFEFKPDYRGNPKWQKLWPLQTPVTTGKDTLTHLRIVPSHGKLEYALVDASGKPKGGFYIELIPAVRGDVRDYAVSMRKALLKSRRVIEQMPVNVNFNDMFTYLRIAFDDLESEVSSEAVATVAEGVVEAVDDPDANIDATKYTNDTLNAGAILQALGYRHDGLGPLTHWAKYISPKLLFVVFYEDGMKWSFQVYRPLDGSGRWMLKTASPGREIRTLRSDLERWEQEARAGKLLTGVNESVDEPNADAFTRTTYDPAAFLVEQGWVKIDDKYHTKTFPVPVPYQMGNMVFTGIQFRIGTELSLFKSVWVSATFVGRDGTGFGIAGKDLLPQLMFAPQEGGDVPPDDHYDINMPIRRFATGIVDEMNNLAWPESKYAAPLANSKVKVAFDGLVNRLNDMAKAPLHPALEESKQPEHNPDDPEAILRSQPGFHFQPTQFMGEKIYVKGTPEGEDEVWPQEIGNVLCGSAPEPPHHVQRWYVINVRGIPQYDLSDYGFGVAKVGGKIPRTFDTKEDAALAIWILRQEMPMVDGVLGKRRQMPKNK